MNKSTLKQLGLLHGIIIKLHNEWVTDHYSEETSFKLQLIKKITKNLEEQKRGFLKSKLPYGVAADFLIENYSLLSASELLKAVQKILIPPLTSQT